MTALGPKPIMSGFSQWLEATHGLPQTWVVAPRLYEGLKARGYTHAISKGRMSRFQAEYERASGREAARIADDYQKKYGISIVAGLQIPALNKFISG